MARWLSPADLMTKKPLGDSCVVAWSLLAFSAVSARKVYYRGFLIDRGLMLIIYLLLINEVLLFIPNIFAAPRNPSDEGPLCPDTRTYATMNSRDSSMLKLLS